MESPWSLHGGRRPVVSLEQHHRADQIAEVKVGYEALLPRMVATFGAADEAVFEAKQNFASLLAEKMGWYGAALEQYDAVVAGRTELYMRDGELTLQSRSNRAKTLRRLGRHDEAMEDSQAVLAAQRTLLGPRHMDVMRSQAGVAQLLYDAERQITGSKYSSCLGSEAIAMMREVVEVRTTVVGAADPRTKQALGQLRDWEREAEKRAAVADDRVRREQQLLAVGQSRPVSPDREREPEDAGQRAALLA